MTLHRITTKALLRSLPALPATKLDTIVAVLLQQRLVHRDELIDALWGDDEDGGPDNPQNALGKYIWQLRHRYGCEIVTDHMRGYELRRDPAPGD